MFTIQQRLCVSKLLQAGVNHGQELPSKRTVLDHLRSAQILCLIVGLQNIAGFMEWKVELVGPR